jgi:hypothetical protein
MPKDGTAWDAQGANASSDTEWTQLACDRIQRRVFSAEGNKSWRSCMGELPCPPTLSGLFRAFVRGIRRMIIL